MRRLTIHKLMDPEIVSGKGGIYCMKSKALDYCTTNYKNSIRTLGASVDCLWLDEMSNNSDCNHFSDPACQSSNDLLSQCSTGQFGAVCDALKKGSISFRKDNLVGRGIASVGSAIINTGSSNGNIILPSDADLSEVNHEEVVGHFNSSNKSSIY